MPYRCIGLAGKPAGWSAGRLAGRLPGRLLVDRLAGCTSDFHMPTFKTRGGGMHLNLECTFNTVNFKANPILESYLTASSLLHGNFKLATTISSLGWIEIPKDEFHTLGTRPRLKANLECYNFAGRLPAKAGPRPRNSARALRQCLKVRHRCRLHRKLHSKLQH